MTAKRTPINRPVKELYSDGALDLFVAMEALECTCAPRRPSEDGRQWIYDSCPGCERWWSLHSKLCDEIRTAQGRIKPWEWPIIEEPDDFERPNGPTELRYVAMARALAARGKKSKRGGAR
jgi:hypothetical protein